MIDSSGVVAATYSKVHLFDVDVPNGPLLLESSFTAPGGKLVSCESPAGCVGMTVCYDLRFPELYQKLVYEKHCTILTVPSAFTKPTGDMLVL
jgi:predicted amidohydrolase